ncbi:transposase [Streptosporangium amethystogenes]|uniref:transposase n=1 Tax=Streptosporangium amethystogenes TaxID=2002 RepID=UPI0037A0FADB
MGEYKSVAAAWGAWVVFVDESGRSLRPPKGRTWAPRGQTPILRVSGKGSGRVSIAGLVCIKPGMRTRLMYRTITYHRRKGEKKGFGPGDFAALLTAAHHQLGGPILVVWDGLPAHVCAATRTFIDAHADWLLVYRFPAYAPELNPAEGVWACLRDKLLNLTVGGIDQLTLIIRSRLKQMQYQPTLLNGFVAETRLALQPP